MKRFHLAAASLIALGLLLVSIGGMPIFFRTTSLEVVRNACTGDRANDDACIASMERISKIDTASRNALIDSLVSDSHFLSSCHKAGHRLGATLFKINSSLITALGACSPACAGGCYHGAAEAYYSFELKNAARSDFAGQIESAKETCVEECLYRAGDVMHGLGHALMTLNGNEVAGSLKQCQEVGGGHGCYTGVFMSNFLTLETNDVSPYIRKDDPTYPCTILLPQYEKACYISQADYFFSRDVAQNLTLCGKFPKRYRDICVQRIAKPKVNSITDIQELASACEPARGADLELCTQGIVDRLSERKQQSQEDVAQYCALLPASLRKVCDARRSPSKKEPATIAPSCSWIQCTRSTLMCSTHGAVRHVS